MRTVDVARGERVRLFNTLAIETNSLCNRECIFCPVRGGDRPDELMPLDMIWRMADELGALKYRGRISLYIYNDPLMDPRLIEIIRGLRRRIPRVCLMISTNGDRLKRIEQVTDLFDAGVNQLLVNVYSALDGHPDPRRVEHGMALGRRRYGMFVLWRRELLEKKLIVNKESVYTYINPLTRVFRVEPRYGITKDSRMLTAYELQNRSGNIPWFQPPLTEPLAKMCVRPFRMLNINWRGDAILCCNDYHGVTNFGNVGERSLVEIWNHPDFHRYRIHLQARDRALPLCATCDYGGGTYPHMVETITENAE